MSEDQGSLGASAPSCGSLDVAATPSGERSCTCHPALSPCQQKFALSECRAAAEAADLLGIVQSRAADFSRKAAEDLYVCLLEATQDYLIDNARFNIGERIASAERQARHDREAWSKAEARICGLLDVLRRNRAALDLIDPMRPLQYATTMDLMRQDMDAAIAKGPREGERSEVRASQKTPTEPPQKDNGQ